MYKLFEKCIMYGIVVSQFLIHINHFYCICSLIVGSSFSHRILVSYYCTFNIWLVKNIELICSSIHRVLIYCNFLTISLHLATSVLTNLSHKVVVSFKQFECIYCFASIVCKLYIIDGIIEKKMYLYSVIYLYSFNNSNLSNHIRI